MGMGKQAACKCLQAACCCLLNHASGLSVQSQYGYYQVFFIGQVAVKQFAIGVHGRLQLLCQGGRGGVGALQL